MTLEFQASRKPTANSKRDPHRRGRARKTVQSVSQMVTTLEEVMKAMDQSNVDMTIADLAEPAGNLLALPDAHARRGKRLPALRVAMR